MTHGGGDGLVFDAEVRRGGFTLAVGLTAACGEVLGLLGPNGAGKSTLLSAVAGLTPVSAGHITLAGQVLDDADAGAFVEASGRPVGFVFQNYRLFPHLTVAENVAFSPRARGQGRRAARTVADHWLDRLALAGLADRKPGQLSGGQAQRVALARALAGQPELLLLDEPLSALDAGTRLDVQAELKRHLADFAGPCLLVTHDPLEALVLADRLLVLEGGRVVQEGTPAQIARQPATEYVAKLVGRAVLDDLAAFQDQQPVGEHERFERVVGDQQARPGEVGQMPPEFGLHVQPGLGVEGGQRLVEQQQRRLSGQRPGQRHPLGLAPGQLGGLTARQVVQAEPAEPGPGGRSRRGLAEAAGPRRERHVLGHAQVRE